MIKAPNNSVQNRYSDALRLNGKRYDKNWLSHQALLEGATLNFTMSATPNTKRGTSAEDAPYSFSAEPVK